MVFTYPYFSLLMPDSNKSFRSDGTLRSSEQQTHAECQYLPILERGEGVTGSVGVAHAPLSYPEAFAYLKSLRALSRGSALPCLPFCWICFGETAHAA